ncbi:MAG TPA: alpha-glucosidase/alpha-galactosidase, partial [Candidatus Binatia bacterium]|nr:alpha-glucosidase/alpha-galactosidase [Candidatus Binatia bacterium]
LVDGNGVQPTRIGELPAQLAGIIATNVNVQSLAVEAALSGKREHVYHAAMLDPHTAAELTLDEIWRLVDDLLAAHGEIIPPLH